MVRRRAHVVLLREGVFGRRGADSSLNLSRDGGQTWTFTPAAGNPDFRAGGRGPRFAGIHNAIEQLADGSEFTGYGLFAAVSFDEGQSWPVQKLITPGGPERTVSGVDKREFTLSDTMSEAAGYLAACQTRDGLIQLISSKNHYVFNLAWLKELPSAPSR